MKKGFTLIELLAVIVILAVIAVISTPIIMGVINNSKKSSYVDSAYGIIDSLKYNYTHYVMDGEEIVTTNLLPDLKYSGAKPESGSAKLDANGNAAIALKYNSYCLLKDFSETEVSILDYDASTCVLNNLEIVNILYEEVTSNGSELNNALFSRLAYGDYSNDVAGMDYRADLMPIDNGTLTYTAGSGGQYYFGFEFTSPNTFTGMQNSIELTCNNCKGSMYFDAVLVDESNLSSYYYNVTWFDSSTAILNTYMDFVSGNKYKILFVASDETISFSVSHITVTSLYYEGANLLYDCGSDTPIIYDNPIQFLDIDGNDVSDKILKTEETLPTALSEITKSNYDLSYRFKTINGVRNFSLKTNFMLRFITAYAGPDLILAPYLPVELTAKRQTCSSWSMDGTTCLSPGSMENILGGDILNNGNIIYIYKGDTLLYTKKIVIYNNL